MDNQNWKKQQIYWKLGLLMIAFPLIGTASAQSPTASEIESTLLSVLEPINIEENPPKKRLKLLSVDKTLATSTSSPEENTSEDILDFSDTGRAGQQTAGEARGQCNNGGFPLTALVPASNWGKTTKKHPIFWFYVPSSLDSATEIEFVFQDEDRNHLWQQKLSTQKTSNYLNVSLPQEQPELEIGKWYRWYLKIYCDPEKRYPPKFVYGWVKRVSIDYALESELNNSQQQPYEIYGKAGIWFDAINSLLKSKDSNAKSLYFQQNWQQLIQAKGVELNLPQPKCSDLAANK